MLDILDVDDDDDVNVRVLGMGQFAASLAESAFNVSASTRDSSFFPS